MCRPFHVNCDRFHQPCVLPWRNPELPPKHGWLLGRDRWGLSVPRTTWRPLTLAGSPASSCASLEVFATPTRRYHGRMLIHPSSLHVPPASLGVCTHACSGPSQVRRRLLIACLGDPIPLATVLTGISDPKLCLVLDVKLVTCGDMCSVTLGIQGLNPPG